jgi:DNA polymerase-3 subunit gamma/tau
VSQALYRKWRPRQWDQVIGQDHITQTLRNAVRSERLGHAYLFAGPRGTGKTTTARLLAKAVNCLDDTPANRPCDTCAHCTAVNEGRFLDLIEIDAASNTSVDDVRDLRDKINFAPSQGRFKVYIIDEVHMLSTAAFNALLKTLEEPPPHVKFILATTEIHKIPATVLSRCQRHEFRRVPVGQIAKLLRDKCAEENLKVDEDALLLIARQATGSLRDAISLLDQLSSTGETVTLAEAQVVLGTATNESVIRLIDAVLGRDAASGLRVIQAALDGGSDPRQFSRQVVEYLRGLLLVRMNNAGLLDVTPETRSQMANQAGRFETARLLDVIRLFNASASDSRSSWQPGLGLELALAEAVEERPAAPASPEPAIQAPPIAAGLMQTRAASSEAPAQPASGEGKPVHAKPATAHKPAPEGQPGVPVKAQPVETRAENVPPPGGGSGTPGMAEIRAAWAKIRAEVKKRNGMTEAVLNSLRLYTVKDGVLVLGYQTDLLKKKMETEENLAMLRAAIQAVLGSTLNVRCVVVGNKTTIDNEDMEVDGDGIVRTALDLGGKIVYKE